MYLAIKHLHVTCVVLSILGFLLRSSWMLSGSALLRHRLTRVVPHLIDTVLLLSAIWLAVALRQYPFVAPWITAKVLGLLAYIVLGAIALRRGRSLWIRSVAVLAAVAVYLWIVSVALSKNAAGFLAGFSG